MARNVRPLYYVTYLAPGAIGTAPSSDLFDPTQTILVKDSGSLSKAGFTFAGWNTKEDGSGTTFQTGHDKRKIVVRYRQGLFVRKARLNRTSLID